MTLILLTQYHSRAKIDELQSEAFQELIEAPPIGNLLSLDKVIIETISYWKRILFNSIKVNQPNEHLSALFNSIFFVRAVEDHYRLSHRHEKLTLLENWSNKDQSSSINTVILKCLRQYKASGGAKVLLNYDLLRAFDSIDPSTMQRLIYDFYKIRGIPYNYNFALMSKHALSRIYEKYVTLMRVPESEQLTLFQLLPEEEWNKSLGSIYTPQFIAKFFARYIENQLPPPDFRQMTSADISCGSGIFLRTLLELQCMRDDITTESIEKTFRSVLGIDVDKNACQATELSLSLLHLILAGKLPKTLNIVSAEAIEYYKNNPKLKNSMGTVLGNPPFVAIGLQTDKMRRKLKDFMKNFSVGRRDLYLAFVKISMEMVAPNGFIALVLPHSFLINKSSTKLRSALSKSFWIRCIADLSAIRVFKNTRSYIILLIAQKKPKKIIPAPPATIIKCQEFVGHALQDCLDGKTTQKNVYYSIFQEDQNIFKEKQWILLGPTYSNIKRKLNRFCELGEFLQIREGLISGANSVFVVDKTTIPRDEKGIFVPFLPDKKMKRYTTPKFTDQFVFYPFIEGRKATEKEIKQKFPKTWSYLKKNKRKLTARLPVKKGQLEWWRPTRPRSPERLRLGKPKIISPYLMLIPRFSIDLKGRFAISHSPLLYPKIEIDTDGQLKFFLAFLNSSVIHWYLTSHSYRYQRGYVKLEPAYLNRIPVPNPSEVESIIFMKIKKLVEKRLSIPEGVDTEYEIDSLITDIYGLSKNERKQIAS